MVKRGMRPSHPGAIIKMNIEGMREDGNPITITEFAKALGISRQKLSAVLNEHQSVDAEMAVRLSEALGTTAQLWLNLQSNYDLWFTEQKIQRQTIRHLYTEQKVPQSA